MNKKELEKAYGQFEHNTVILDVQLDHYRNAYHDWDFSPITSRDLDSDLMEYLIECSNEIPLKYKLKINFYILKQEENKFREDKSILGIKNYFAYQLRKLKNKRIKLFRDILTFATIGAGLLLMSMYLKSNMNQKLYYSVLSEGFSVGGWVMFWEMFTVFFFDLKTVLNQKKHYERLLRSEIAYNYSHKNKL